MAVDGNGGVIQGGQQVGPDVTDVGGVAGHALKHIVDVFTIQRQKTGFDLLGGYVLAADTDSRAGTAQCFRNQLCRTFPATLGVGR